MDQLIKYKISECAKYKDQSDQSQSLSGVWLFATPRTVAHQAPLSTGFPRQEYWNCTEWSKLER